MGSSGTMKLVSIGLLLLMAYCIAIGRQAMQTSVPSRHSQCESLCPHTKKRAEPSFCSFTLCGQRDSNPHASRHQILSLTWLPITPCPQDLAFESLPIAFICGAKIYTFYNICNFIYDFLEIFSYFCVLNTSYCVSRGA